MFGRDLGDGFFLFKHLQHDLRFEGRGIPLLPWHDRSSVTLEALQTCLVFRDHYTFPVVPTPTPPPAGNQTWIGMYVSDRLRIEPEYLRSFPARRTPSAFSECSEVIHDATGLTAYPWLSELPRRAGESWRQP